MAVLFNDSSFQASQQSWYAKVKRVEDLIVLGLERIFYSPVALYNLIYLLLLPYFPTDFSRVLGW